MQAYFGLAKATCLYSYTCNHHRCYDRGRLGRVKIVTLRVGATPLLLTRPIFSPHFEFQHTLSRAKHSRTRRKHLHCRLVIDYIANCISKRIILRAEKFLLLMCSVLWWIWQILVFFCCGCYCYAFSVFCLFFFYYSSISFLYFQ